MSGLSVAYGLFQNYTNQSIQYLTENSFRSTRERLIVHHFKELSTHFKIISFSEKRNHCKSQKIAIEIESDNNIQRIEMI